MQLQIPLSQIPTLMKPFQQNPSTFPQQLLPNASQKTHTVQDFNYMHFYIDRQLSSNQIQQIKSGLQQLRKFLKLLFENKIYQKSEGKIFVLSQYLQNKTRLQLLTPVVIRLLDLLLNLKVFGLKKIVGDFFILYANMIKQTTTKDQVIQVFNKMIKGVDQYTRVIALKMIPYYSALLEKDLIVFEYIIQKVQDFHNTKTDQVKASFIIQKNNFQSCLKQILSQSTVLSQIFVKNIQKQCYSAQFNSQIQQIFINQIRIDKYYQFCLSAKFHVNNYFLIFSSLLKAFKLRSLMLKKISQQICTQLKMLIQQLFIKFLPFNFTILQTIYELELQDQIKLPRQFILKTFNSYDNHQKQYLIKKCTKKGQNRLNSKIQQLLNNDKLAKKQKMITEHHARLNDQRRSIKWFTHSYDYIQPNRQNRKRQRLTKLLIKLNQIQQTNQERRDKTEFKIQLQNQQCKTKELLKAQLIIAKRRRLMMVRQFCEIYNLSQLICLIKIWQNIFSLIQQLQTNFHSNFTQNNSSSNSLIQQTKQLFKYYYSNDQLSNIKSKPLLLESELQISAQILALIIKMCNTVNSGHKSIIQEINSQLQSKQNLLFECRRNWLTWTCLTSQTVQQLLDLLC